MNTKNLLKLGALVVVLLMAFSFMAVAQTTWYVNNQTGNDGRNGLSATIPTPDDFVTGPKKTIGGAQGAFAESNSTSDVIIIANTGVAYGAGSGEPATIALTAKRTFQASGGTVAISSLIQINNAVAAPNNTVVFNSGDFQFTGGLTLTVGVLDNGAGLITVSGTITRAIALATVSNQLLYTGTVDYSYGATMTTANEFHASGSFRHITTTAGNLTLKTTAATMTGVFTTVGTLNLGGNALVTTNTAAATHAFGGNVTNGTLDYNMGGGDVTVNGAFALPTVIARTSTTTARTLMLAQPTSLTGTLTVSGLANVTTSAALVTIGTTGFSGNTVTLSGTGAVTLTGAPTTVHGNILLNSTGLTAGGTAQVVFNGAGAVTVNGNVSNEAGITVANSAALTGGTTGLITFPDQAITITGNVVNAVVLGGTIGTSTDTQNNGQIRFVNAATNVTINGAITNSSSTSIASALVPVAFTGNGSTTWANNITTGIVRADGGITNSSNWAGVTNAANVNNGAIIIGGAARTGASTIGTAGNRVGAITNSSVGRANGDGNGDIIIGVGDGSTGGFFGTSVTASGSAAGGYTAFGNENFNINGSLMLTRTVSGTPTIVRVGSNVTAGATVTIGGTVSNQSNTTLLFNTTADGAVAVTGNVSSTTASGTISFPNITTAAVTFGGLSVSAGTVSVAATHNGNITINGAVSISGGTASLLADGGDAILISGNASFTAGTITTTGVATLTLNSASVTIGGASTNPTFSTAGTEMIIGAPTPTTLSTVTIGGANPILAGALTVNNATGLVEAVRFTGGTLRVTGVLTFTAGNVVVADQANLIALATFLNTSGYSATGQARITVGGAGAGQLFGGAGSFGTIEFNNAAGMASSSAVTLAGTIYLTAGAVDNAGGAITINNSTDTPTIVRNAGSFNQAPTFSSSVNVTYIGGDKASGNELPVAATRLQNLTVATTNGAVVGQGVVTVGTATTVNGTIQVNASQALLIDGVNMTMNGAAITLNGDIANEGAGQLVLARTAGTTITGTGYLPPITVAAGSSDNVIAGRAIINQLVGVDNARGGGDDFVGTTTAAQGALMFAAGTNSATVTLTGVAFDGSMAGAVTTNAAGNTLNLGGNFVATGALTHNAGTINVGTFTYEQRGAAINLGPTASAMFAGSGSLKAFQANATTNSAFTLTSDAGGSSIGINVEVDNRDTDAGEDDFILATGPLTIAGGLTVSDGELVLGQNLTLTGIGFTVAANGSFSGAGVLRLNATLPPLTFTYAGTPSIANLRISNDVNLAGAGTSLTITTAFTHDGGVLNFGAKNLTFQTAFTRTAGSYDATTGYMIIDANAAWTVSQGTAGFSIPNLRVTASGDFGTAFTAGAAGGTVTVTKAFDVNLAGATTSQTFTTNGKLAIADLATVTYTVGTLSAAPTYAGTITLVSNTANNVGIPAVIWPAAPATLVTTFRVNNLAAANASWPIGNRSVTGTLDLRVGILDLSSNNVTARTLTVEGTVRRRQGGSLTLDRAASGANVGTLTYTAAPDVVYEPSVAAGPGAIGSGPELPATVNDLTITRSANVANATTTINTAVTVNGTLAIRNNLTTVAVTGVISANGDVSIAAETSTYANATAPVTTFGAALQFVGATAATITVPSVTSAPFGTAVGSITIDKTGGAGVTLAGGNLIIGTGTAAAGAPSQLNLINGLLTTGNNIVILSNQFNNATQGYTRNVAAGNKSHVVGNLRVPLKLGQIIAFGSNDYPVGDATNYRPASLTFVNAALPAGIALGVSATVNYDPTRPTGIVGLPIADGVELGTDVARYPDFNWSISTTGTLGATQFNLALTAEGYTGFDDVANVRIIRRNGAVSDITNQWLLQGTQYDNFVISGNPTVTNVNSIGGLIQGGAIFTYGLKTTMVIVNPIAPVSLNDGTPSFTRDLSNPALVTGAQAGITYSASVANTAIVTATVTGNILTVTMKTSGATSVTVTGTDTFDGSRINHTFQVNAVSDVEPIDLVPTEFTLSQNYPNPFNPSTTIKFGLPKEAPVTLEIYNVLGVKVRTLIAGETMSASFHTMVWDGKNDGGVAVPSGVYLYRVHADKFQASKKMTLIK